MKLKKILLFLTLMLSVCYDIEVSSTSVKSDINPDFRTTVLKINDYKIESIHKELMSECNS